MPDSLTPAERSSRARLAAHVLHSKVDPTEHTAPARAAFIPRSTSLRFVPHDGSYDGALTRSAGNIW